MVMVNGKWWPQKVILVPLASPSGGRRKDWRAQWRQWYISLFTFLLLSFSSFCSFPQLRAQEGQQNIFPLLFFYFFVFLIESTMQAVVFFSCFFLVFSVLKCFSFCFLFPSSPAVRFEKGFQSFLFLWKKKQNLFNWSHLVLSLQTYFSASHIMISGCKSGGQSLTVNPNANSNAKVKVITKSHCTDDVGALSMHKPSRAFERGSDVHLTESDKVTPEGKRGSKSQLREWLSGVID